MNTEPVFTVFTATFNRRHLLDRVYRSLCAQTFRDFEWLVIDDGSTDDTASLIAEWTAEQGVRISYHYQLNQGRHRAYNRAIRMARGSYFAMLDSDDAIVPNALERLLHHWESIPSAERGGYSGVTCLCRDEAGRLVGRPFPKPILDCRHFEADTVYGATGEKWGFHRTAVVRRYPFPELDGERFCAEGLVWNRIGRAFTMRHINEPLKIYYSHGGTLTARIDSIRIGSPQYARRYYREYLDLAVPSRHKLKKLINYVRFSVHAGVGRPAIISESRTPLITSILYPLGWAAFALDNLRRGKIDKPTS